MSASVSFPVLPTPTPRRPVGVVLAAIALALLTLLGLLLGSMELLAPLLLHAAHSRQLIAYPAFEAVQVAMGIVILLISAFCAWTVVDLFRAKRWARISILILGGALAFFSLIDAALFCLMAFQPLVPPAGAPQASPVLMKTVLLGIAGVCFAFALIGVWWVVYFNLRRVRALFTTRIGLVMTEPMANALPDSTKPGNSTVGILVNCLAILYLIGAVSMMVTTFLRLPVVLFDHVFHGTAAALLLLFIAAFSIATGIGLIRRLKPGWVAALAFNAFGGLAELTMMTRSSRALMGEQQREIMRRMATHGFAAQSTPAMLGPTIIIGGIGGLLLVLTIFWLLFRAKPLFEIKAIA